MSCVVLNAVCGVPLATIDNFPIFARYKNSRLIKLSYCASSQLESTRASQLTSSISNFWQCQQSDAAYKQEHQDEFVHGLAVIVHKKE
ncbi:hypothetical protein DPMN_177745 [Dreissena polymorpha]|uniref:Uncharacterized protein n=1 Tax=Dreissena polymorpha TaxID=45954 RepID=A0A9D4EBK3_DREPO|nr:hypothetical protein DPMN_177745 [Dreissena polymorpha]